MNTRKIFITILTLCLIPSLLGYTQYVQAEDFAGKEDKYIQLCSSKKLTSSQQETCKNFNTYLSKKNEDLSQNAENTKKESEKTKASIDDIAKQITDLDSKINDSQKELTYIENNITSLNEKVETNQLALEDRMYAMQTTMNSHSYINFLFGAEDFVDFIGRLISFQEITSYDNELIQELNNDIAEIQQQQATMKLLTNSLQKDKLAQTELQNELANQLNEQNKAIASNNSEISKNQESMDSIQSNLAALKKAADESKVDNVTQATPDKKPSKPSQDNPNTSKPSNPDTSKPDTPEDNPSDDSSSSEELGLKIANKALTRLGYMYVWGGAHSWSTVKNPNQTDFDCSGLVNWAFYQCGVDLGRIHYTGSLVSAGKSVSKSNLQAGDIILFSSNGKTSGVHHVGIYIGGNKMVHAPTTGEPVQVSNLNTNYWQNEWFSCRRLY